MLVESATPPPMSLSSSRSRLSESGRSSNSGSGAKQTTRRRSLRNQLKRESRERNSLGSSSADGGSDERDEEVEIPSPVRAMTRSELRSWAKLHPGLGVNGNSSSAAIRSAIVKDSGGVDATVEPSKSTDAASPLRFGWSGASSSTSSAGLSKTGEAMNKRHRRKGTNGSKIPVGRWR